MGAHKVFIGCLLLSVLCPVALAELVPGPQDVFVRVVDCGAALCCVVKMPGPKYMIYDEGNYVDGGAQTFSKIEEIIPAHATIELMVLSHSDSDHLGAVNEICDAYTVKKVLHSGYKRTKTPWKEANQAIKTEKEVEHCREINLKTDTYPAGTADNFGGVSVSMVCGFCVPPKEWGVNSNTSKKQNAGSIVVRLVYMGNSILFAGDAVGRIEGHQQNECIATEKYMVEKAQTVPIDSDVLIGPHHGADTANSTAFIRAVTPQYVVFSARHKFGHPRAKAVERYLNNGVPLANIFRTDRGDDESKKGEWSYGRIPKNKDKAGDDDVDILLRADGAIVVA